MASLAEFMDKAESIPEQDYKPIPDGWYQAEIKKAELKATKDGAGEYLNVQYQVLGPSHAGRVVFGIMNIRNKSADAEAIGLRQLKELRLATGIVSLRDTDELVGRTLEIKVSTDKSEQYGDRNKVNGTRSVAGSPVPAVAATSDKTPPWARK